MKVAKTSRGFRKVTFQDRYHQPCSLQKSSLAGEDAVWFGVDTRTDLNTGKPLPDPGNRRMHLTPDHVRELLPLLQHFVDHGELP